MSVLKLKPDIAAKLVWSRHDSRITPFCSVCQNHIPEDSVPFMMWNQKGDCVQFCDACASSSFKSQPSSSKGS